jgi:hypothetical protein
VRQLSEQLSSQISSGGSHAVNVDDGETSRSSQKVETVRGDRAVEFVDADGFHVLLFAVGFEVKKIKHTRATRDGTDWTICWNLNVSKTHAELYAVSSRRSGVARPVVYRAPMLPKPALYGGA